MKLITAVIGKKDLNPVCDALEKRAIHSQRFRPPADSCATAT